MAGGPIAGPSPCHTAGRDYPTISSPSRSPSGRVLDELVPLVVTGNAHLASHVLPEAAATRGAAVERPCSGGSATADDNRRPDELNAPQPPLLAGRASQSQKVEHAHASKPSATEAPVSRFVSTG